jgi:uncharacterized protein (TIGR02284 family)
MTVATLEAREIVNKLVETCLDTKRGFELASQHVNDKRLKVELREYGRQRQEFADELRAALAQFESDDNSVMTQLFSGVMHSGWNDLKRVIAGDDRHRLLDNCVRADQAAIETYCDAVSLQLPEPLNDLIENQYESVQRIYDRIQSLCEAQTVS